MLVIQKENQIQILFNSDFGNDEAEKGLQQAMAMTTSSSGIETERNDTNGSYQTYNTFET